MCQCIKFILFWNDTLHVSDGLSVHHQEFKTVHTGVFPGGKGGRCVRLTTLPPSCAVVTKSGSLNFLEPSGPLRACNGTALPLPYSACFGRTFRPSSGFEDSTYSNTHLSNRHCCLLASKPEWPRGFQEVKAPRFRDNGTGWW